MTESNGNTFTRERAREIIPWALRKLDDIFVPSSYIRSIRKTDQEKGRPKRRIKDYTPYLILEAARITLYVGVGCKLLK